jgi:hypothetical protein
MASNVWLSFLKLEHVSLVCAGKIGRTGHKDDDDGNNHIDTSLYIISLYVPAP